MENSQTGRSIDERSTREIIDMMEEVEEVMTQAYLALVERDPALAEKIDRLPISRLLDRVDPIKPAPTVH